jgi:hypothetical protein
LLPHGTVQECGSQLLGPIRRELENAEAYEFQTVASPFSSHDSFRRMIRAQHVPDFVCKHMPEKPLDLNAKLLDFDTLIWPHSIL